MRKFVSALLLAAVTLTFVAQARSETSICPLALQKTRLLGENTTPAPSEVVTETETTKSTGTGRK